MTKTDWPTEQAATAAVDAAAQAFYAESVKRQTEAFPSAAPTFPDWEELDALDQRNIKEAVLVPVYAALQALPDPRHAAWEEGKFAFQEDNPYPSSPA